MKDLAEPLNPELRGEADYCTARRIADILLCSKQHVYNLANGKVAGVPSLPAIRLGRTLRFDRKSVARWAAKLESSDVACDKRTTQSVP